MFTGSIYEFLILIGVILIIIDIFIPNDVSSLIAHSLFSMALVWSLDLPLLYAVIVGILVWMALVGCHYLVFKNLMRNFLNKYIAKTVIEEMPMDRLVGCVSKVESFEGKDMIRLEGDLIPVESLSEISEGMIVRVVDFTGGVAFVSQEKNNIK